MKRWLFIALALVLATGFVAWQGKALAPKAAPVPDRVEAITVLTTKVLSRDIPIWLTGIGTVEGYNTVIVRPRVGGILESIDFTEGAMVKKGDVLARIDPRPYEAALALAQARKAQNEALLVNATQERERMEQLIKSKSVSQQALEQAAATVAQLEAAIRADVASIATAQLELDYTSVLAPISGRTGIRHIDAGNLVIANQQEGIVHLTQLQPVTVVFTLPQKYLGTLHAQTTGKEPSLKIEALDEQDEVLGEGALELIDNRIDLSTGTLRIKARFENKNLALWPGQFVTARALVKEEKDSIVVPTEVIQPGLDGPFAYLIQEDDSVEARSVAVGPSLEGWTVIEEGLKLGDEVVQEGQSKLKPGALIKRRDSAL